MCPVINRITYYTTEIFAIIITVRAVLIWRKLFIHIVTIMGFYVTHGIPHTFNCNRKFLLCLQFPATTYELSARSNKLMQTPLCWNCITRWLDGNILHVVSRSLFLMLTVQNLHPRHGVVLWTGGTCKEIQIFPYIKQKWNTSFYISQFIPT